MARLARAIFPGLPHHVTQRGNGRSQTFFDDGDYVLYRDLLGEHCAAAAVGVWGWVLMPNHVHLILVPEDADGLRRALAAVHRRYAGHVHARLKRTGHFWQGRFGSIALDEPHLAAALRYVAMNPVRAGLVERTTDWPWSSVHAWLDPQRGDGMTIAAPVLERQPDIAAMLAAGEDHAASDRLRHGENIGRPLGNEAFVRTLEQSAGRQLARPSEDARRGTELISALSP